MTEKKLKKRFLQFKQYVDKSPVASNDTHVVVDPLKSKITAPSVRIPFVAKRIFRLM